MVEDDAAVLVTAVESLGWLGYRTLLAMRVFEALERLEGPGRFEIPFPDVVIPGGTFGMQLSVQARRLGRGLRVLPISG